MPVTVAASAPQLFLGTGMLEELASSHASPLHSSIGTEWVRLGGVPILAEIIFGEPWFLVEDAVCRGVLMLGG